MVRDQSQGGQAAAYAAAPSMLDLLRLSPDPIFLAGGEEVYRQIARLTEMAPGTEVLTAACGRGTSSIHLATAYGVECAGVDVDANLVREAESRALQSGVADRVNFQRAALDDLPYRDGIFDVSIGELALATSTEPSLAIRELARVTKPLGSVVLVQLTWTGHVDPDRRESLVRYLGARPMMLIEWKQMLREAGIVDLVTEDWSDRESPFRPRVRTPFPDFAEIFTVRQKLAILRRALGRWGWRGVRGALVREAEVHRLLTRERVLGLSLIRGTKWAG